MATLIYFLGWGALIFVLVLVIYGAQLIARQRGSRQAQEIGSARPSADIRAWTPAAEQLDPVCGVAVDPSKSKSCMYQGRAYYFCSPHCREQFEESPEFHCRPGPRPLSSDDREYADEN